MANGEEKGGKALVILSGGQDSTTALFWAKTRFGEVRALTINYGQRHAIELEAARKVAELAEVPHEVLDVGPILLSTSPLVDASQPVAHYPSSDALPGGLEATFIPGRNPLFMVIAANRAAKWECSDVVMGLCQADFGGYYDCRQIFVDHMAKALSEAIHGHGNLFRIHTPLMFQTKKESVKTAKELGPVCWEALGYTHTDYDGLYPPNPFNHASLLRARGFNEADEADPLILRAVSEGKLPADYPLDGLVEGTPYGSPDTWAEAVRTHLPSTAPNALPETERPKKKAKKE
jgi:7-cyano-7-deazaguanine synthase